MQFVRQFRVVLVQFHILTLCTVPMHTLPLGRVLFGAFDLDLTTGELRSIEAPDPNNRVLLREQVFQVLRMLLEREGKIVTRKEIKRKAVAGRYGRRFRPQHQCDDQEPASRPRGLCR